MVMADLSMLRNVNAVLASLTYHPFLTKLSMLTFVNMAVSGR